MKKKFLYLLIFFLFSRCGFTPLYTSNNVDYKISITQISGDNTINTNMVNELKKISKPNSKKNFKIKIDSNYEKKIISKDLKGSASDYQLIATVNIQIEENDYVRSITFLEKQNIKKSSDSFDQINYENTIKGNFAASFVRKLNLELSTKQ